MSRAAIGHNGGPSFDDVVRENIERGVLIAIKDVIVEAVRDPRLERRHLRVLAEVIDCMNVKTGASYPGRRGLAERSRAYDVDGNTSFGYTEQGIAKTISELVAFGYLVSTRKASEIGGRALAHYTIRKPSQDELKLLITDWIASVRAKPSRPHPYAKPADVTSSGNVTSSGHLRQADVTSPGSIRPASVTSSSNVTSSGNVTSDVTSGVPTVTSRKELGVGVSTRSAPNEDHVGHGVLVNGETIRHATFVISLPGIQLNTIRSGLTASEVKDRCLAHALQWAAEIENGADPRKVLPQKIGNFLAASIMSSHTQAEVAGIRKKRASEPWGAAATEPDKPRETRAERYARILAEETGNMKGGRS